MICPTCLESSQHSLCPYCGTPDASAVRNLVGWEWSDVLQYSPAYQAGKYVSSATDSVDVQDLPQKIVESNPAYQAGKYLGSEGGGVLSSLSNPFAGALDTASSFLTVVKWVLIGGAVVGAIVLLYGVFKFVPVALGLAASNAREVGKMAPQLIAKAV